MSANRQKRTARLTFRLTPGERRAIEHRAADCQLSTSAYVRSAALDAAPRARRRGDQLKLIHMLANLGMAIDQVTWTAQREDLPDIEDALLHLRTDLGDIMHELDATYRASVS